MLEPSQHFGIQKGAIAAFARPYSHPAMFKLARRISPESREIPFVQRRAIRISARSVNDPCPSWTGDVDRICENRITAYCPARSAGLMAAASQECSSVGRASVSKTEGPRFESVHSCHFFLTSSDRSRRGLRLPHRISPCRGGSINSPVEARRPVESRGRPRRSRRRDCRHRPPPRCHALPPSWDRPRRARRYPREGW